MSQAVNLAHTEELLKNMSIQLDLASGRIKDMASNSDMFFLIVNGIIVYCKSISSILKKVNQTFSFHQFLPILFYYVSMLFKISNDKIIHTSIMLF